MSEQIQDALDRAAMADFEPIQQETELQRLQRKMLEATEAYESALDRLNTTGEVAQANMDASD